MNVSIAREVYQLQYIDEMNEEKYMELLETGLNLLRNNPNTDKIFINRFYKGDDLKAINIALMYNQELMVKLLAE